MSDLDITQEVDQGEIRDTRTVYLEVDGSGENGFVGGYGKVRVHEGSLEIGEIRHLPETENEVFSVSVLFLDTRCADEREFDGSSRDHVVSPVG